MKKSLEKEEQINPFGLLYVTRERYAPDKHRWLYSYRSKSHLRRIRSTSLRRLRQIVEEKGFPWIVIDIKKAKNAYDLDIKENRRVGISGVHRVSRKRDGWVYILPLDNKKTKTYHAKTLKELKKRILNMGLKWMILDNEKYKRAIKEDF